MVTSPQARQACKIGHILPVSGLGKERAPGQDEAENPTRASDRRYQAAGAAASIRADPVLPVWFPWEILLVHWEASENTQYTTVHRSRDECLERQVEAMELAQRHPSKKTYLTLRLDQGLPSHSAMDRLSRQESQNVVNGTLKALPPALVALLGGEALRARPAGPRRPVRLQQSPKPIIV